MTIVHLCCSTTEARQHLAAAVSAVQWAISRINHLEPRPDDVWSDASSPVLGYVQRSVNGNGEEIIRIRPDSTSTDDDVVLEESPLRNAPAFGTQCDRPTLRQSLDRWLSSLTSCSVDPAVSPDDRVTRQREVAALVAGVINAVADGPRIIYVVYPPSIHRRTQIVAIEASDRPILPDEGMLLSLADRALGDVAWLMPRKASASVAWTYVDPSNHAFTLPACGPDAMTALRAHAALEAGLSR